VFRPARGTIREITHSHEPIPLVYFGLMSPKLKALILAAFTVLLFLAFLWSVNLTLYNWWAAGGPPVEHPEIYRHRGNVFFVVGWGLLAAIALLVRALISLTKGHS
jgi:hypothetical protein